MMSPAGNTIITMKKLALLGLIGAVVLAFFALDLGQYLSLEYLKSSRDQFQALYAEHPFATAGAYFLLYVTVTALSLPGAAIMTLAGGALFGLGVGFVLISFASTIGATLAFLAARFVLRDSIRRRFGQRVKAIDAGVTSYIVKPLSSKVLENKIYEVFTGKPKKSEPA